MLRLDQLSCVLVLSVVTSGASAVTFTWNSAVDTTGPGAISTNGTPVEAFNGIGSNSGSVTVNGVTFANSNALLPNNGATGLLGGVNTGNASLNALLDSVDFGGGTSTTVSIGNGLLVPGKLYELQVFFTDLRTATSSRVMTYGDGSGNNINLSASGGAFGQNATATFFADAGSLNLTLIANGFANTHITAYQIRELAAPSVPEPTTAMLGLLGFAGLIVRRRRVA